MHCVSNMQTHKHPDRDCWLCLIRTCIQSAAKAMTANMAGHYSRKKHTKIKH